MVFNLFKLNCIAIKKYLPSRSVAVRHLGQGFVDTLIFTLLASSHLA